MIDDHAVASLELVKYFLGLRTKHNLITLIYMEEFIFIPADVL